MQNVRGVWHCACPPRRLASKEFEDETFGRRESMRIRAGFTIAVVVLVTAGSATGQFVAKDPGVRNDPAAAGKPLKGLSATPNALFEAGRDDFAEPETVAEGLGPRFNLDSWSARAT
jgi:hypothetical protein